MVTNLHGADRSLLEAIYACAHFLQPVLVEAAPKVFEKLGAPPRPISQLSPGYDNLAPGTRTVKGTFNYMAPEAFDPIGHGGAQPFAALSRTVSLGCLPSSGRSDIDAVVLGGQG